MFYTRDFPGWAATLDGNAAEIEHDNEQGLITIEVPAGTHIAATHWGTTPARVIGAIISFVSLVFALIVLWRTRK